MLQIVFLSLGGGHFFGSKRWARSGITPAHILFLLDIPFFGVMGPTVSGELVWGGMAHHPPGRWGPDPPSAPAGVLNPKKISSPVFVVEKKNGVSSCFFSEIFGWEIVLCRVWELGVK